MLVDVDRCSLMLTDIFIDFDYFFWMGLSVMDLDRFVFVLLILICCDLFSFIYSWFVTASEVVMKDHVVIKDHVLKIFAAIFDARKQKLYV